MKTTGIERVDEQQERERIAHEERKRAIARTPEILEAFGVDRQQPAPTPRPDASRRE